jgi:hypothetical protein
VLFWNPTLEQRTTLLTSSLAADERQSVKAGHGQFSSLAGAQAFVRELRRQAAQRVRPSTTTTVPPTTTPPTTAPPTAAAPAP